MKQDKEYQSFYVATLTLNAVLGAFYFGYQMGIIGPMSFVLNCALTVPTTSDNGKCIESSTPQMLYAALGHYGAAITCFFAGKIADRIGRKNALHLADLLGIIGVGIQFMPNIILLLIGRLICGFSVGLNSSLVGLYINEMAPTSAKGIYGLFNQIFICVGILASTLMAFFMDPSNIYPTSSSPSVLAGTQVPSISDGNQTLANYYSWRFYSIFPGYFILLRSILLLTVFNIETPSYLLSKSKEEEARVSLYKIYYPDYANSQLMALKKDREAGILDNNTKYSDLWSKKYVNQFIVGLGIFITVGMCGSGTVSGYAQQIFSISDGGFQQNYTPSLTGATIFGIVNLVFPLLTGFIIEKVGRRTLLIYGTLACTITLVIYSFIGTYWNPSPPANDSVGNLIVSAFDSPTLLILLFNIAYNSTLGAVCWIYASEVLPGVGIGIVILVNWLLSGTCNLLFTKLDASDAWGQKSFLIFAGFCLGGTIFFILKVKETKGKQQDEIAEMFRPAFYQSTSDFMKSLND